MKKVLSLVLCLSMVLSLCAAFGIAASAAEASVTAKVVSGSVAIPGADKLALLCDGNDASSATAFSDAGLVAFENTGFTHTDGVDAAVEATVEFVLDLGEVKPIGGAYMTFFNDTLSMVALPTVVFEGSVDGECWYNLNAGNAVAPATDAAETATATIKADFTTRAVFNLRYVKATATFKNGWIFAGEIGTIAGKDGVAAVSPEGPYPYTAGSTPTANSIGVFGAGTYDLTSSVENSMYLKASQIIVAKKDASGNYVMSKNDVNPWPDGHSGTVTIGEDEILVSIVTGGNVSGDAEKDPYSAAKWAARGLSVGDVVVLDEENGTIAFYPAEHFADDESSYEKGANVALNKSYVTSALYRMGGKEAGWGWDENAAVTYPDEDGVSFTDGVVDPGDNSYSNVVWGGFSQDPVYKEVGYHTITVDLGKATNISEVVIYVATSALQNGIGASNSSFEFCVSNDNTNWESLGTVEGVDNAEVNYVAVSIEAIANARYVQVCMTRGGWLFVSEVEVYEAVKTGGGSTVEKTSANLETDIGIMLLNDVTYEGVVGMHTTVGYNFNSAWRTAVLLENVSGDIYKVIAVHGGGSEGPNWTIGEGQIVVEANTGNDWPSLFEGATGDEWYYSSSNGNGIPYSECPNFISAHVSAWYNNIAAMAVGSYYTLVGCDVADPSVDANYVVDFNTDSSYGYTNEDYVTYTYLTPNTEVDTSKMGTAPETSGFTATLTGPSIWAAGDEISVDVTIEVTADEIDLANILFDLYYDAAELELVLPEDVASIITGLDSWKEDATTFAVNADGGYNCLSVGLATVVEADTLKKGDTIVVSLTFKVLDSANGLINLQLSHDGLNGYGYEDPLTVAAAGTGSHLAIVAEVPEDDNLGDAGIYLIAALALVAMLGTAVVIKKRA